MDKTKAARFWRIFLGIATGLMLPIFIMAFALGLSWLIATTIK